jgi:hypothetical protein
MLKVFQAVSIKRYSSNLSVVVDGRRPSIGPAECPQILNAVGSIPRERSRLRNQPGTAGSSYNFAQIVDVLSNANIRFRKCTQVEDDVGTGREYHAWLESLKAEVPSLARIASRMLAPEPLLLGTTGSIRRAFHAGFP